MWHHQLFLQPAGCTGLRGFFTGLFDYGQRKDSLADFNYDFAWRLKHLLAFPMYQWRDQKDS